jgi:hypothetical protein
VSNFLLFGQVTTNSSSGCYLVDPVISSLDRLAKGFVVFAAKRESFKDTFPQAAVAAASFCEIKQSVVPSFYGLWSYLILCSLSTIRGCVTSGERWLFFVYEKNLDGGPRGVVRTSLIFELERELNGLALILGLLRDWVRLSLSVSSLSDPSPFRTGRQRYGVSPEFLYSPCVTCIIRITSYMYKHLVYFYFFL